MKYLVGYFPNKKSIEEYIAQLPADTKVKRMGRGRKIMGFPEDYVLVGTQADQKKFIGNAVEVTIARAWCEALCERLSRMRIKNIA